MTKANVNKFQGWRLLRTTESISEGVVTFYSKTVKLGTVHLKVFDDNSCALTLLDGHVYTGTVDEAVRIVE